MADTTMPSSPNADIETRAEAEKGEEPMSSSFWLGEIAAAKKRDDKWWKRGNAVVSRYRDERASDTDGRRANILWSNTELLKGSLFEGISAPDVRRRFPKKGPDERAARTVAIVLERALSYCQDTYDAAGAIECIVEDSLLPGRGTGWIVYEAEVEEPEETVPGYIEKPEGSEPDEAPEPEMSSDDDATGASGVQEPEPYISDQSVRIDHVYWQDFLHSAGRKWSDVWWVSRKHLYSRDELKKYFPQHGDKIPLGADIDMGDGGKGSKDDTFKRAEVWEIWDKSKKQRVYIADGYEFLLKTPQDDPYKVQGFYPAVEPIYSVKTTSTMTPVPEYLMYQDQAKELDQITTRIHYLVDALKRRGVYDASMEGGDNQLSALMTAGDNEFVPYKGFAALMEKGGLRNVFQTEDLSQIITVVQQLYLQRAALVQQIYEITGISDVLRGASNPNETATAQRIKANSGSLRIQKRQQRVQNFQRDMYRLKAELIAEHFTREKLIEMTGIEMPTRAELQMAQTILQQAQAAQQMAQAQPGQAPGMQAPMMMPPPMPGPQAIADAQRIVKLVPWEDIEKILRSNDRRGYKIDIETDQTVKGDDLEQKQARIEFLTSMQGFLGNALPAAMQEPALMPLVRELTNFGVRAFKIGRSLEDAFDDAFDQLVQSSQQQSQQPPPQDPRAEAQAGKMKAETEALTAATQAKIQTATIDAQIKQQKAQADALKDQADIEGKKIDNETKIAMAQMQQMLTEHKAQIAAMQAQMRMGQQVAKAFGNGAVQ